jgi:hypothetical protein
MKSLGGYKMNDEDITQGPVLDLPWLLAGGFIVLIAGFTFILFSMAFVAGLDDMRFLGDVAAFVLIFAVAMIAVLLFVAANGSDPESAESAEALQPYATARAESALELPACASCGRSNPQAAKFCYNCGSRLN